eukprot:365252-Chlamydomonas_euryale.AAC.18
MACRMCCFPACMHMLTACCCSRHKALTRGDDLCRLLPVLGCLGYAAARCDVHARINHCHLNAHERTRQHELVHVTKVADAEHLSVDLCQANAERQVILCVRMLDDLVRVNALGRLDHSQRVTLPPRLLAQRLQAPAGHRPTAALCQTVVACNDVLKALLLEQAD